MADKFLDKTGLAYFWEKIKAYFQSQHTTPPEYTIVRLANEEVGYAASYVLKKDGTQVGATINIPKDYLVRSGEVKTVTVADEPYEGAVVGDKYLDFVVNTVDDSGNISHIYILVSDLVDAYTEGNGIDISNANVVSVVIDQNNANGLSVSSNGVALALATTTSAGAMSIPDKIKLENAVTRRVVLQENILYPSGGICTWTIGTTALCASCSVYEVSTGNEVLTDLSIGNDSITIKINSTSNISAGTYKVVLTE